MFVVPLPKDIITTKDGASFEVVTYSNFKPKGPAVYVQHKAGAPALAIYFFDIDRINDIRVELNNSAKVFNALGKIKRSVHLPQPNDQITVRKSGDDTDIVQVKELKLHSKVLGLSKGLLVKDDDGNYYRLGDIEDIKQAVGGDSFNRKRFLRLYSEYRGYVGK